MNHNQTPAIPCGVRAAMTLHERERDGSLYINQGSPLAGPHQAFDIACDRKTAEEIVASYNQLPAVLAAVEKALAALSVAAFRFRSSTVEWEDAAEDCEQAMSALRALHDQMK